MAKNRTKTQGSRAKKPPAKTELQPMKATAATLIPTDRRESLTAWFELYLRIEGGAEGSNTFKAKRSDLEAFLTYFLRAAGRDKPDQWTRSLTEGFLKHLQRDERKNPSTINRVLATLKHAAKWIESQRPFLAGNPTERVHDLLLDEPEWKGLPDLDLTRLRSAAEQLLRLNTRKNQQPLRDYAILVALLQTGLRVSEVLSLDLDQYRGKHFTNVSRKGKKVSRQVLLPKAAREVLDKYIDEVRGKKPGPLFCSKNGTRLARQNVHDALQAIANQANSTLPKEEHIHFSAHVLRHTMLRRAAEKHGVQYAKELSGHASDRYIWRYVQPSEEEKERALEDLF